METKKTYVDFDKMTKIIHSYITGWAVEDMIAEIKENASVSVVRVEARKQNPERTINLNDAKRILCEMCMEISDGECSDEDALNCDWIAEMDRCSLLH